MSESGSSARPRGGDVLERGEKRAHVRWIPAFHCPATIGEGNPTVEGVVVDLSDGGLRVASKTPLARSEEPSRLVLTIAGNHVERLARVVWTRGVDGAFEAGMSLDRDTGREAATPIRLDLSAVHIDPRVALRVPTSVALRRRVLPLCEWDGSIVTACADLGDRASLDTVGRAFERPVLPQPVGVAELARETQRVHGGAWLSPSDADGDHVGQLDQILYAAWLRRASDVHVCPERDGVHVFLRADGQLESYQVLSSDTHAELLSRIKVLGGMDIAERRAPQDGRFTHVLPGDRRVDVRVATLPTNHGERATLRLLAIESDLLTLENLGMSAADLERGLRSLRQPHGMILATGPTGCGKTTSLFAALREITARRRVNAIALQEPVEYDIPGISQVEIDTSQKISFASALRSIMRHDPDVIMIGEIRDAETASIAIKAALTGHLVLATLHTNNAASVVTRLADMGVERYLMAATLRLVIAQRLVRRLCPHCRRPRPIGPEIAQLFGRPDVAGQAMFDPAGCVFCAGRGFHGRLGVFEILEVGRELRAAIRDGAQESEVEASARKLGMASLRDDALDKLLGGAASLRPLLEATELADAEFDTEGAAHA